ncbi:MAG: ABC transporter permease, partial [Gemmatimonadaceae bacterium]
MSVHRDIDAELRFHFETRIDELVGQGLSRDDARAQAMAEFGDVEHTRANLREIASRVVRRRRRADRLDAFVQDVSYSLRSLARTPSVSLTIIVTLALGLGANATMFSLLDAIYVRAPAAVAAPSEIRRVWAEVRFRTGTQFWSGFDYSSFDAIVDAVGARGKVATYLPSTRRLGAGEAAPEIRIAGTSANYFSVLGVRLARGRTYTTDENDVANAAPVAVVSDAFWKNRLDADPSVLGRELSLGGDKVTVIGVLAPGFRGIDLDVTDVWLPVRTALGSRANGPQSWWKNPNVNGFQVIVRPSRGARASELTQRITLALRQASVGGGRIDSLAVAEFGAINRERGPGKVSGEMQVATRLVGVAIIVLLIACANVVNLLLARAVNRRREIAIRLALGISRARLVRLLIIESVLMSLVASAGAVVTARWGGAMLRTLLMPDVDWAGPPVDWRVFAFALAAALIVGALAGLVPALRSSSPDLTGALRTGPSDGGLHRSR